ncbi:metallophosphoesterase [Sphingomonas abietis]|uniref:Metallophosphoesterase n=1 Tax=Sphingomonas abietis TaxID=3012344 RepID=A0ABY7NH44_9SPHN|nr:metallophosphoesterase [Sphingomonas abietis]WBO20809.1 metallophosphoesterase [Sphingomonas abietis]
MRIPSFLRRKAGHVEPTSAPAIPPGERVYAIGDVHGCADELERLLDMIAQDHAARGPARQTVILLGDLVNRGPDSARAVQVARDLLASGTGRLVKGNHEELFILAGRGDRRAIRTLLAVGGLTTLASFGLTDEEIHGGNYHDLALLLKQRIPRDILAFLDAAEQKIAIGDYLFVHAGIRPGVPITEQNSADLRWIRDEFLTSQAAHGAMVVHGHTITETVAERENRIGIDTGAYQSGILTAIGLEGSARWFLSTTAKL